MQGNEVVDLQQFRKPGAETTTPDGAASHYLPAGTTLLVGQYIIDGYLNCGGFGITYTARDSLGRKVVIKECFPNEMVYRNGKAMASRSPKYKKELASIVRNFVTEAHSLANVKHDNIVHVHQIFEENGTAYLAMDFIDGPDLLDMLEGAQTLKPAQIETLTRHILDAIRYLHRIGMLHRDISPDNILVQRDGTPVLIDFGAARHFSPDATDADARMKFVKDGYSPQEFYVAGSPQSPASDLYAFAATIYHLITGTAPVDAQTRLAAHDADKPDPYKPLLGSNAPYPARFLRVIDQALALMPEDRVQSADVWLERIGPDPSKGALSLFKPVTAVLESLSVFDAKSGTATSTTHAQRRPLIMAGAAGVLLLVGGAVVATQFTGRTPAEGGIAQTLPREQTPSHLARIADLPAPTPLVSVWPDGFAALRNTTSEDPTLSSRDASAPPVLAEAASRTAPTIALPAIAQADAGFRAPDPIANTAPASQPDVRIALHGQQDTLWGARAPNPPQKLPLTDLNVASTNQLSPAPSALDLKSISPVALEDKVAPLPTAPAPPTLSLDTSAPAYVPPAAAQPQPAYSRWDIELPFTSRPQRISEGNALVITQIKPGTDLSRYGEWIEEGLILVGLNGTPLRDDLPLETQILDSLSINPEGQAQVSLFYRAPREDVLDQAILTLPILRVTGLSDGTVLETRKQGASWVTRVVALGAAETDLELGDLIIGNASSPTRFTSHSTVETALTALVQSDLTSATFSVLRKGQRTTADWRFPPSETRSAGVPPAITQN